MAAMAIPLPSDKLDTWRAWAQELNGPRKADFDASNARHHLTAHHAWLQTNPDGSYLVIVIHDGPGGDDYMSSLAQSDDPFDQWFFSTVADVHGMAPDAAPPAPAEKVL